VFGHSVIIFWRINPNQKVVIYVYQSNFSTLSSEMILLMLYGVVENWRLGGVVALSEVEKIESEGRSEFINRGGLGRVWSRASNKPLAWLQLDSMQLKQHLTHSHSQALI
jgi:hypothetical protein